MNRIFVAAAALFLISGSRPNGFGQDLEVKWEELTSPDFVKAIEKAQGTCLLPFGVVEKHGPHLPMYTDTINSRFVAVGAAKQEYAVVFPEYYFSQIDEARHQPGTIAYSSKLMWDVFQETTAEMSRNGCKKIIAVPGHGGNLNMLQYFAQLQLESPKDFVLYVWLGNRGAAPRPGRPPLHAPGEKEGHAGEAETAAVLDARPDLVHLDRATSQSGEDLARLKDLPTGLYTGIWWYAKAPNHYQSSGTAPAQATKELGAFDHKGAIEALTGVIKAVKADTVSAPLQKEFFERSQAPLKTKQ
jgi:creatinine amidohydrolase